MSRVSAISGGARHESAPPARRRVSGFARTSSGVYERGGTTGTATAAIIQSSASITFEAPMQVRNKMQPTYRGIMNIPIE
ncbi:flagellar hook-basal body complex protein FliE [Acetobacter tropicalis]|uniref:flagellar hook-basal body complex protein FliE n=1 Tax=Acetobacter tropicalis TaxID=104102 RepID=UPI0009EF3625